jgi:hypothetical protein
LRRSKPLAAATSRTIRFQQGADEGADLSGGRRDAVAGRPNAGRKNFGWIDERRRVWAANGSLNSLPTRLKAA